MERLQRLFGQTGLGAGAAAPGTDTPMVDNAEMVYISSLALLKMLKHGRAGVPMEVMGLMLGEFVDDYTVRVIDVFAMPQSGTGVSVEAVDPVFQTKMLDMLKQTGRPEMVVGWYHSHPGFGCWLSGVDINCFPVKDHQILTERGFLFYHEVAAYLATNPTLGVAAYVKGQLVYQPITAADVTFHDGQHRLVNIKGARQHVDLQPTDNHHMWVRLGRSASTKPQPDFRTLQAYQLVQAGRADTRTTVEFCGRFEAGAAHRDASGGLALPFVQPLGLHSAEQVDAFLWLYGYWLGAGWLDGGVCVEPKQPADAVQLDRCLSHLGLPRLSHATEEALHGYWRQDGKGQCTYRICSAAWWKLFAGWYGRKHNHPAALPTEPQSAKWLFDWVLACLNKRQLRIMLCALQLAQCQPAGVCTTWSERFRDELMQAALHAGYAAHYVLFRHATDEQNRYRVQLADGVQPPCVQASELTTEQQTGGVWCVTVPRPHLIMVRRVQRTENGEIVAASRPLVVGNTQQSFEQLNQRAVAVVVDPIQSVKGKVVIDAFRLINTQLVLMGQEPRQTTSNIGHLNKPSIQALIHALNRHYYSIAISYRKSELEQKMLMDLHKKTWTTGLTLASFQEQAKQNERAVAQMVDLAARYNKAVQEEDKVAAEKLQIQNVGKIDPKKHLADGVHALMSDNIVQTLATMLDTIVF